METIKFRVIKDNVIIGYEELINGIWFFYNPNSKPHKGTFKIPYSTRDQFINLLDKTKKEIYNGDIVKLDGWAELQIIKFIEGAFCIASVKEKYGFTSDIHYIQHAGINQATVVGNIYENKNVQGGQVFP